MKHSECPVFLSPLFLQILSKICLQQPEQLSWEDKAFIHFQSPLLMKSSLYFSAFALLLSSLFLSSCVNEPDFMTQPYQAQELYGEDYLRNYLTPEVMFHFATVDEGWETVDGIIIDKQGRLFSYELSEIPFDFAEEAANRDLVERLMASGTTKANKVDVHDLVENFKKIRRINRDKLLLDTSKPTDRYTQYLIAYDLHYPGNLCVDGSCPGVEPSADLLSQYILKAEGFINGENSSIEARQIATWMKELKSGF